MVHNADGAIPQEIGNWKSEVTGLLNISIMMDAFREILKID
jgi:hypothetical protein